MYAPQLDLRSYALVRSEAPRAPAAARVAHGRVTLTLPLPVGSDPGSYEMQVLDSALASPASAMDSPACGSAPRSALIITKATITGFEA